MPAAATLGGRASTTCAGLTARHRARRDVDVTQAWPSNIEVTEPSSKTSRIARGEQRRDREAR